MKENEEVKAEADSSVESTETKEENGTKDDAEEKSAEEKKPVENGNGENFDFMHDLKVLVYFENLKKYIYIHILIRVKFCIGIIFCWNLNFSLYIFL